MNHDIFISYSSKQKSIADGVCHYLEENGFKCWMAPRDIPVGSEYGDLIEEAIKASKVVVLVFSEAASISKWVKGEINVAFTEDKPILPFRIDETEIKGGFRVMLNQMHWIDAYPHYADRLPDLLKSIYGLLGKPTKNVNVQGDTLKRNETVKEEPNPSEKLTNSFNGHEFVDLGLPSGALWATYNVGANKPEEFGNLLSWVESDKVAANWGDGWHIPTKEQWKELIRNTKSTWAKRNDVNGRLFMANNGNVLFLPAAGYRNGDSVAEVGSGGHYVASSPFLFLNVWYLYFSLSNCHLCSISFNFDLTRYGQSTRLVRSMK